MPLNTPDTITQICSHEKDDYYMNSLRGLLSDIAQKFFGPATTLRWSKEIGSFADVLYFSLTTLTGLQTLGEEYTNIIQVDHSGARTPQRRSQILMIVAQAVLPLLVDKFLTRLQFLLDQQNTIKLPHKYRDALLASIPKFKALLATVHRLHLSLFYLRSVYYTIAKRVSGIGYVKYFVNNPQQKSGFQYLGYVTLAQCLAMLMAQIYGLHKDFSRAIDNQDVSLINIKGGGDVNHSPHLNAQQQTCLLCYERRRYSTVTACGHVFCWYCIHNWVNVKPECPLCREQLEPRQLTCLKNF